MMTDAVLSSVMTDPESNSSNLDGMGLSSSLILLNQIMVPHNGYLMSEPDNSVRSIYLFLLFVAPKTSVFNLPVNSFTNGRTDSSALKYTIPI